MNTLSRRTFLGTAAGLALSLAGRAGAARNRMSVLLLTADDMNWSTPGCFGGTVPGVTPNIDRLAAEGMRFMRGHVTCAVCQPSREALMTGRYPHRSGGMGFEPIRMDVPTLQESLRAAGWLNGILGKVEHLKPDAKFPWDFKREFGELGCGRDPQKYAEAARAFFEAAEAADKPFFLMANSHDPHRPFDGSRSEAQSLAKDWGKFGVTRDTLPRPSRVYTPEEVSVPGFLPDLPDVRAELAQYYSSCRRSDDTVGAVLGALAASGQAENTLVMFLSDNGMAFPFAKANCYLHGTRTPWIVRWPGRVAPDTVNAEDFISGIDFMPTVLDALDLPAPDGMDGASSLPLLRGEGMAGRDRVFTQFHATSAGEQFPMRCVQDGRYGYIFNVWVDGVRRYRSASMGSTMTFRAMEASTLPEVVARTRFCKERCPEELYDFATDPDALKNLADDPAHACELDRMRGELLAWMEKTGDPFLPEFLKTTGKQAKGG